MDIGNTKVGSLLLSVRSLLSGIRQDISFTVNSGMNAARGAFGGQTRGGAPSSNQVAPYPNFPVVPYQPLPDNRTFNQQGNQPPPNATSRTFTGDGGGGRYNSALALGALGTLQAIPGTKEAVAMQLATSRMVFYQQQASYANAFGNQNPFGPNGNLLTIGNIGNRNISQDYRNATAFMQQLQQAGTVTGKFDAAKAFDVMRQYGISAPNLSSVMMGAAQMSNLTPGIGIEGSARAYAGVQQARNVNMLRGIGIRVRGEDGSLKPMPQIIDELWNKLNREKVGTSPLTVQDVTVSLQPGNALASLLDQYFGNDPLTRKQVEDGLILKARSGGATFAGADLKKLGERFGATTAAQSSLSQRISESTKTLQQIAPAMSSAFTFANRVVSQMTGFLNLIDRFTGILKSIGFVKSGADTVGSAGNFGFSSLLGLLSKLPGKADGGDTQGNRPYIVGERGPELFVPKTDGYVVPNHSLRNYPFRHDGGAVHVNNAPDTRPAGAGNERKDETEMRKILSSAGFGGKGLEDALKISYEESKWRRYAFNPHDKDLSYGLFQINMLGEMGPERRKKFGLASNDDLFDPYINAKVAYAISKGGTNWGPWSTKGILTGGGAGTSGVGAQEDSGGSSSGGRFTLAKFLEDSKSARKFSLSDFLKDSMKGATTHNMYNYGGVTVNLSGGGSPEANVAALRAALSSNETLQNAARS